MAHLFQIDPLLSVRVRTNLLFLEAVPESEQLDDILGGLLEDDEAINAPCVEA